MFWCGGSAVCIYFVVALRRLHVSVVIRPDVRDFLVERILSKPLPVVILIRPPDPEVRHSRLTVGLFSERIRIWITREGIDDDYNKEEEEIHKEEEIHNLLFHDSSSQGSTDSRLKSG